jgi:hypothetical protein
MANKIIKFGSVFGNYKWNAEAEITDGMIDVLLAAGCLQFGQRSPSTAAEKEMAGYEKRPKGFSRDSIPFSETGAKTLEKHIGSFEIAEGVTLESTVTVEQYFGAETAESKYTAERAKYVQRKDTLDKLAKAVGYDGPVGDGTADNAPKEFLVAIRAWVKAQADAL